MDPRPAADLARVDDPAWPEIEALLARGVVEARVLPVAEAQGRDVLYRLQVTARSPLGALALHTGGIVVDHGWLRLLGGGAPGLPSLADANGMGDPGGGSAPSVLVVGYDVLGGVFAIDGGGLGVAPGQVCWWGPDTLAWLGLEIGHSQLVVGALNGGLADFYASLRWPGWEDEVSALALDQGLSLVPPPFTAEGKDLAQVSRRPVPHAELLARYPDLARCLDGDPPATS